MQDFRPFHVMVSMGPPGPPGSTARSAVGSFGGGPGVGPERARRGPGEGQERVRSKRRGINCKNCIRDLTPDLRQN